MNGEASGGPLTPGIVEPVYLPLTEDQLQTHINVVNGSRDRLAYYRKALAKERLAYPECMAYERITIDPGRMRGLPCIRDTRLTVSAVLGQLAAGRTAEQVLEDYSYLERADILAALEFAADAVQEHELPLARPA